jgi:RimJ/RimL family protein N-acetyltransferase
MAHKNQPMTEGDVRLRPWEWTDADALVRVGDDRDIWLNLRERFPHPFTIPTAHLWLADQAAGSGPPMSFAILRKEELAGGIRLTRRTDAHFMCADLTFWTGRAFWGQGIARAAVKIATAYAIAGLGLDRVQGFVFDWNPAGAKVLEWNGFQLEGRLRHYVQKDDRLGDALLYARLKDDPVP